MTILEQRTCDAIIEMARNGVAIKDSPDYWTRLEHQYAGMALQGLMAHTNIDYDEIVDLCVEFAHALVEKLKSESNG